MTIAERTQSTARPGTIRCSDEAREAYLASSYHFEAEDADDDALTRTIFPAAVQPVVEPVVSLVPGSLEDSSERALPPIRVQHSRLSSSGITGENPAEQCFDAMQSLGSLLSPDQSMGPLSMGVGRFGPKQRSLASSSQPRVRGAQRGATYTVTLATPREDS